MYDYKARCMKIQHIFFAAEKRRKGDSPKSISPPSKQPKHGARGSQPAGRVSPPAFQLSPHTKRIQPANLFPPISKTPSNPRPGVPVIIATGSSVKRVQRTGQTTTSITAKTTTKTVTSTSAGTHATETSTTTKAKTNENYQQVVSYNF
jgi:hypothetical protein